MEEDLAVSVSSLSSLVPCFLSVSLVFFESRNCMDFPNAESFHASNTNLELSDGLPSTEIWDSSTENFGSCFEPAAI